MVFTSFGLQGLIATWTILSCLPPSLSQSSSPSNGSLPVDSSSPQLTLNTKQSGMQSKYDVDPLTNEAGLENSVTQLQVLDHFSPACGLVLTHRSKLALLATSFSRQGRMS